MALRKAIVIGGGIAGESAALSLQKNGFKVNVYEQFKELLDPIGAGVGLNGGALCLTKLGYRHLWEDVSTTILNVYQVSPKGSQAKMFPLELLENTKMEGHFVCLKRDEFLKAMYNQVMITPDVNMTLGEKAVSFSQTEHDASVTFQSGLVDTADIVICADGIHSIGKDYVTKDESLHEPHHTGYCVYYGIVPAIDESLPDHTAYEIDVGGGSIVLMMPLPNREAVVALCHPATKEWNSNDRQWAFPVAEGELYDVFKKHDFFEKQNIFSEKMMQEAYRVIHLGVFEQQNLPQWHKGRVCVIGDGAHAISPFLGQGANQAIQDSYLLGILLTEMNHEAAFSSFYAIRHPTMQNLITASKGLEYARMGDSYLSDIMRRTMRGGVRYAPDFIVRKMLMATMAPSFIKK